MRRRCKFRAARKAAKRPRSEAKPSEARAPAKDGRRAKTRRIGAGAAFAALLPIALAADPGHGPAHATRFRFEPPPPGSYELPPIDRVSEHVLLGSDGRPAPLLDLRPGEAALVSFVYLSCGEECPLSTATLHSLDRQLAADAALAARVKLVTVSFDPARDTPERMAALAKGMAPLGRWQFLTSDGSSALAPVLADFGQDSVWLPSSGEANAPDRLRHVLKVFLVDAQRDVRNVYSTGLLDERLVLNDLRTVLGASAVPSGAHLSSHH